MNIRLLIIVFVLFFVGILIGHFDDVLLNANITRPPSSSIPVSSFPELIDDYPLREYAGNVYIVSYPANWAFSGPYEAPITGFSEYTKLISPSGDMQISIGLEGDNRFEYFDDVLESEIREVPVSVNGKLYTGQEEFLKVNGEDLNLILLDVEISDKKFLGLGPNSKESYLPVKVQMLYHFPVLKSLTLEEKLESYELEKTEALKILKSLNFR